MLVADLKRLPGYSAARETRFGRAAARRLRPQALQAPPATTPPPRPVGAKFELTYACNLRCGFCYTDSPRRTLERTPELSDADWRSIVEQAIDLGVMEAVVSGGEPLLRSELALEVLDRFETAGVQVSLNTNGWFVDEAVAGRLARLRGLHVLVSLDGVTPEQHDRARGVPGSWRRAVRAIALLAERGVHVSIVHVVTPANERDATHMLEHAWRLGAATIFFAPVVPVGAAARGGEWRIDQARLRRQVEAAAGDRFSELTVHVRPGFDSRAPAVAPTGVLVRPDGAVRTDSITPFRFGDAVRDGLDASWARVVAEWDSAPVRAWREPIREGRRSLAQAAPVPYRDPDVDPGDSGIGEGGDPSAAKLPRPAPTLRDAGDGDVSAARAHIRDLALDRTYRLGAVRWTEGTNGGRYVRVTGQTITTLNRTAALVMDACGAPGTLRDAVAELSTRYPDAPAEQLESDAIDLARRLVARGVLVTALTPQVDDGHAVRV